MEQRRAVRRAQPHSAGIVLYRETPASLRVLLAHPGGPFFAKKDAGAWTLPKGLLNPDEDTAAAARREFAEECGWRPDGGLVPLGEVKLRSGKRVAGFALLTQETEESLLAKFAPGTFTMEWPPRSGASDEFPEVDRIEFFSLEEAKPKLNPGQIPFLDRLAELAGL
jgi:predicted NUDIX family NTP pyrophosphohydrolase